MRWLLTHSFWIWRQQGVFAEAAEAPTESASTPKVATSTLTAVIRAGRIGRAYLLGVAAIFNSLTNGIDPMVSQLLTICKRLPVFGCPIAIEAKRCPGRSPSHEEEHRD